MIEIKADSDVNFFMLLYEISKNPNLFSEIRAFLKEYYIIKKERDLIKQAFNKGDIKNSLKHSSKLKKIYLLNKTSWKKYWNSHLTITKKINEGLKEELKKFDISKLRIYSKFFETSMPKSFEAYICIGNTELVGRGNSFCSNKCVIFPRDFENFNKDNIKKDFRMLMHEIIHLMHGKLSKNKGFVECLTKAFAPKGLLFDNKGIDKKSTEYKLAMLIKKAIKSGRNYVEIKNKLVKAYRKQNKKI